MRGANFDRDGGVLNVMVGEEVHPFDLNNDTDWVRLGRLLKALGYDIEEEEGPLGIHLSIFVGDVVVIERNDGLVDYEGVEGVGK